MTSKRILTFVCLLVVGSLMVLSWWQVESINRSVLEESAVRAAKSYVRTLASVRSYYTEEVVNRIPAEAVKVSHDFREHEHAIPLPATLAMELAEYIRKSEAGFDIRLFSEYPFPWRVESSSLDDFEKSALAALRENPDQSYVEVVESEGGYWVRYAEADVMQAQCLSCHNTHPESPKTDWKEGDVRGVLAVKIPLSSSDQSVTDTLRDGILLHILAGVILILVVLQLGKGPGDGSVAGGAADN